MLAVDNMESGIENKATLGWNSVDGFTVDVSMSDDELIVQVVGVPVPADGKAALRAAPVELNKLEILFKSQVDVAEAPGQLAEATIQLVDEGLRFAGKVEDAETGQLIPFEVVVPVLVEPAAPESGGPVPKETTEEDLDWDDEATFEKMMVDLPPSQAERKRPTPAPKGKKGGGGMVALLKALQGVDRTDDGGEITEERMAREASDEQDRDDDAEEAPVEKATPAPETGGLSASDEARRFLQMLLDQDAMELEEDATLDPLVGPVGLILRSDVSPSKMASGLANFLMNQEGVVADLYIDDDSLEELLSEW